MLKIFIFIFSFFSNIQNETIWSRPEVYAEYPGGILEFYKFVGKNLKIQEQTNKSDFKKKFVFKVVIKKDGSVGEIIAPPLIYLGFEQEAKRLLLLMPIWKPAQVKSKNANSYVYLPFYF